MDIGRNLTFINDGRREWFDRKERGPREKPPIMTSVGACGGFWVSTQHGPTSYSHQALGSMN